MVVPFRQGLEDDTRTLEEIGADACADNFLFAVKENLGETGKMKTGLDNKKRTWMYFPNRDELSLRVVLAFPNASRIGLVARICRSISLESSRENLVLGFVVASGGLTDARYRMINLAYTRNDERA